MHKEKTSGNSKVGCSSRSCSHPDFRALYAEDMYSEGGRLISGIDLI
jgi:hypothetical protein